MAFAGLTCGTGINIFMNSIESSLMEYTKLAANSLDKTYVIGHFSYLFIMIILTIAMAIAVAYITEKIIIPKLGKYEDMDKEEFYLDKKKREDYYLA